MQATVNKKRKKAKREKLERGGRCTRSNKFQKNKKEPSKCRDTESKTLELTYNQRHPKVRDKNNGSNKIGAENFIIDEITNTTPTPWPPRKSYQGIIQWPWKTENSSRRSQSSESSTDKAATITAQYKSVGKNL